MAAAGGPLLADTRLNPRPDQRKGAVAVVVTHFLISIFFFFFKEMKLHFHHPTPMVRKRDPQIELEIMAGCHGNVHLVSVFLWQLKDIPFCSSEGCQR